MTYEEELLMAQKDIAQQLKRIAEVNKINLWLTMQSLDNDRQKKILSDVLKKL